MNRRAAPCNPRASTTRFPKEHAMNASDTASAAVARFELRFDSLFHEGRAYSFPCDEAGHVDIDALAPKARLNYFYARTVIGREFSIPAVHCVLH
jgi:hypothetical protein